jgi:hypothetical protein
MENQFIYVDYLREIQLPIPIGSEAKAGESFAKQLSADIEVQFLTRAYLDQETESWRQKRQPSTNLRRAVEAALDSVSDQIGPTIRASYFLAYEKLGKRPRLSHDTIVNLLSHLRFVIRLAVEERMSSAKISQVIAAIDLRLSRIGWRDIQALLESIKLQPTISKMDAEKILSEDLATESIYFADAGLEDCVRIIAQLAVSIQFPFHEEDLLEAFFLDSSAFEPYIAILYYQCLISERYHHLPSHAYEFNPRSKDVAESIMSQVTQTEASGNAFLNNAKSVNTLDFSWAASKKSNEIRQAFRLAGILAGLDALGLGSQQMMAGWLRKLIVRRNRLSSTLITNELPLPNLEAQIRLCKVIAARNTETYGILEQRLVDLIAVSLHDLHDWRSKGLGDSVNASNFTRRKIGDCDFQNPDTKTIHAFEAHGGKLSISYFDSHAITLDRAIMRRRDELEGIAPLEEWKIIITFIAHKIDAGVPQIMISQFFPNPIMVNCITFEQALGDLESKWNEEFFESYFWNPINAARTPQLVRNKLETYL